MARYTYEMEIQDYDEAVIISNADLDMTTEITYEAVQNPGIKVTVLGIGERTVANLGKLFEMSDSTPEHIQDELSGKLIDLFLGRVPGWKMVGAALSLIAPSFTFVKPIPRVAGNNEALAYEYVYVSCVGYDYAKMEVEVPYGDGLPPRRYMVEAFSKEMPNPNDPVCPNSELSYILTEYLGKRKVKTIKHTQSDGDDCRGICRCYITEY